MYFVNMTTGFLPLLLSDYSLHYISVEKISILIVIYKLLLKTIIPMHEKNLICMYFTWKYVHLFNLTYSFPVAPNCDWNWGNHTYVQHSEVMGVLTVPLHLQAQSWASQRASLSSAVFFLKNQFKQNALLHKNVAAINVLHGLQRTLSACLQCSIGATGWVPNSASC